MGTCCATENSAPVVIEELKYEEIVEIRIKERDIKRRLIGAEKVAFRVKHPIENRSESMRIGELSINIHGAILPNMDPKCQMLKDCQDYYFFMSCGDSLLAGLFDGHGPKGKPVSRFCANFMSQYFHEKFHQFQENPAGMISQMIQDCDRAIMDSVDVSKSGTTAVLVFLYQEKLTVGSVGDSRGILASRLRQEKPEPLPINDGNTYKRKIDPARPLFSLQLSIDHKPNHENEMKRIKASGGTVEKLTNESGDKVGPYRVWKKNQNKPGLAMSRSIGDLIAKEAGVIAEPTINEFPVYSGPDQFIVIGSDGVWDVLSNSEAVHFVDKFIKKCSNSMNSVYPAKPSNCTIAHLLAEEARYRWFGICEEEDVLIDDISVIVIQFANTPGVLQNDLPEIDTRAIRDEEEHEVPQEKLNEIPQEKLNEIPIEKLNKVPIFKRADTLRSSQVCVKPSPGEDAGWESFAGDAKKDEDDTNDIPIA